MSRRTLLPLQDRRCCTWCGHPPHRSGCGKMIVVAAGPSGGPGRSTPTQQITCPCTRAFYP